LARNSLELKEKKNKETLKTILEQIEEAIEMVKINPDISYITMKIKFLILKGTVMTSDVYETSLSTKIFIEAKETLDQTPQIFESDRKDFMDSILLRI